MNTQEFYAIRQEAAEAMVGNLSVPNMQGLVEELRSQGSHDSTRLAAHMILEAGIDHFEDVQVVETIFAACGHSICAVPNEGEDNLAARAWRYRYEVPDPRLDAVLDLLADYATALLPEHRSIEASDVINLGDALLARRLKLGAVEPQRLLGWLVGFGGKDSYVGNDEKDIANFLRTNDEVRRSIQQLWFAKESDDYNVFERHYRLTQLKQALAPTDSDIASLLDTLPIDHELRFEFMRLTRHTVSEGAATRDAALRFFPSVSDRDRFFEPILNPKPAAWEIEREARARKRKAEQDKRWADFRRGLASERNALEAGRFGVVLQVANVYLGRYSDLRGLTSSEDRLEALCGADLIPAALSGLEAYLNTLPPYPHAERVSKDYGQSRAWSARYILLASLAERVRRLGSIGTVTIDQLIAAQLHIAHHCLSDDEWQPLREAVWAGIIQRADAFERYARLLVEPFLRRGHEHVSGLYELLHEGKDAHPALILALAGEWLERFPRMHARPEGELIDILLARGEPDVIGLLIRRRLRMKSLNEERRRNWQAAGLVSDFAAYAPTLANISEKDQALFWAIRERIGARRPYDDSSDHVSSRLAAWLVENFRRAFPVTARPSGVTMGDSNAWDATEAISRLIDRLGADPSAEAGDLLERITAVEDGYRDRALAVLAEYRRNRAEQARALIGIDNLRLLLSDGPPQSLADMQTKVLGLLGRIHAQTKSNDTDVWLTFFHDDRKRPHDEEYCRDRVIDLLRQHEHTIQFTPEKHLGDDREGDIACEYGGMHLPVEVKGQWHDDLWHAADAQLSAQQAVDHRAEGFGILLVLWFGDKGKKLKGPPRGSGLTVPSTPSELERSLATSSKASGEGRIRVKVLDLSRD